MIDRLANGSAGSEMSAIINCMCARFTLRSPPQLVVELFDLDLSALDPRFNIAPTQDVLAVRVSDEGEREFARLRWGLVPLWATE